MRYEILLKRMMAVVLIVVFSAGIALPVLAADDGNWRRGRIYYRLVCTVCHMDLTGESISPMSRTIAEWKDYVAVDRHDVSGKSNPSLKYYVSNVFREKVKESNKAAAKFIEVPEDELLKDVRAWVVHGAKDSDTPARCQ